MTRRYETFSKTDLGHTHSSVAYTDDGKVWRWKSNDKVLMLETCEEYGVPCDKVAQAAARSAELDKFFEEYRKQRKNHQPSAEEQFEMEAAFGPGVEVVNIITGQRFRT
jgi:hypothetical protein